MIKSADLPKVWAAPDNSRLTGNQYSFRLPVHVAAKLAALEEMYQNRTRTEIVGDLLSAALDEMERAFLPVKGRSIGKHPETDEMLFDDVGIRSSFYALANRHYKELEKELGNDKPQPLYPKPAALESDFKDS